MKQNDMVRSLLHFITENPDFGASHYTSIRIVIWLFYRPGYSSKGTHYFYHGAYWT